jgi:glucose-1-phosphate thymidylyltransferase
MAGLYFFGPQLWSVLPDLQPSARGEYEITDAIQMLIDRGETVLAGIYDGIWFDTGTLDSFLECSSFLTGGGQLVGVGATVDAPIGERVVIGDHAVVEADYIEDSVILPGAKVKVAGSIRRCLIGGDVLSDVSLENQIVYDL